MKQFKIDVTESDLHLLIMALQSMVTSLEDMKSHPELECNASEYTIAQLDAITLVTTFKTLAGLDDDDSTGEPYA